MSYTVLEILKHQFSWRILLFDRLIIGTICLKFNLDKIGSSIPLSQTFSINHPCFLLKKIILLKFDNWQYCNGELVLLIYILPLYSFYLTDFLFQNCEMILLCSYCQGFVIFNFAFISLATINFRLPCFNILHFLAVLNPFVGVN